ncbi:MAG: hypothetical protein JWM14_3483 [Chitinophagaceae bacterium]|nr:hypothetical protein [Chitinophagaceae bacterium]
MSFILRNRISFIIFAILLFLTSGAFVLAYYFNPERMIKGKWVETGWSYENIDKRSFLYRDVHMAHKHESESWRFLDNNQLHFYNGEDVAAKATWRIKGRGHVLQLTYEDGDMELYDIKELNDHELILNFDIGMESRGIARLVFTKVANK